MLLEVKQLRKEYLRRNTRFNALHNLSFALKKGEAASIVGRSGSGKSTLLNIAAGLLTPTAGTVVFKGVDLFGLADEELAALRNRSIGYLPQGTSLLATLTALENVCLPHYLADSRERGTDCYVRGRELLRQVGLEALEEAYPAEMSGGEMLRVAIARALINAPELIVADEPTSDLDRETSHEIMQLLMRCNEKGTALLLVTHDLEMAACTGKTYRLIDGALQPE